MLKRCAVYFVLCCFLSLAGLTGYLLARDRDTNPGTSDNVILDRLAAGDLQGYARVTGPRTFRFPEDHGPHPRYKNEWWYFTGNLETQDQRPFGYELTFFRIALTPEPRPSNSAWRSNQFYMAHFAVTDAASGRFHAFERFSRGAMGLAGARQEKLQVWLDDWSVSPNWGVDFPLRLQAQDNNIRIDLTLTTDKPMVLQGQRGYSKKSAGPGQASYYYSFTRLPTVGTIQIGDQSYSVGGSSWMDREWSTSSLSQEQAGWDWFALQLSDGFDLMFYQLRRKDGLTDTYSAGTYVDPEGSTLPLSHDQVSLKVLAYWQSPDSGIRYPSQWRLLVPGHDLDLVIQPLIPNQELNLTYKYWEGAVALSGKHRGKEVKGRGYVELVGYR